MFLQSIGENYNKTETNKSSNLDNFKMADKCLEQETVTCRRLPAVSIDFRNLKVIQEINNLTSLSGSDMFEDMDDDSRDSGFENYFCSIQEMSSTLCFEEQSINLNDIIRNHYTQRPPSPSEHDFLTSEDDMEECLEYEIVSIDNDDTIPLRYSSNTNDLSYGAEIGDQEISILFDINKNTAISLTTGDESDFEFD